MPKLLLEWFFIGKANLVLDSTCTPELIRLECKGIMVREQELSGSSGVAGSPLTQTIQVQFLQQLVLSLPYRHTFLRCLCIFLF